MITHRSATFKDDFTSHLDLKLTASANSVIYIAEDPLNKQVEAAGYLSIDQRKSSDKLKFALSNEPLLAKSFREVRLALYTLQNYLYPVDLLDNELIAEQDLWMLSPESTDIQDFRLNEKVGIRARFHQATYKQLQSFFDQSAGIVPLAIPFLSIGSVSQTEDPELLVHVEADRLMVAAYRQHELQFYNSFRYSSADEFLYFVMLVTDRLSFSQEQVQIVLQGEIAEDSAIVKHLHTYFSHISFNACTLPPPVGEEGIESHFFTTTKSITG